MTISASNLREIQSTTHEALREMRLLIFELRPPILKRDGLVVALQTRLDAVEGRFGLAVHFVDNGNGRLSPEVEEGLYRVAQEALNNVLKHACASSVTVSLKQNQERISLEVYPPSMPGCTAVVDAREALLPTTRGRVGSLTAILRLGGRLSERYPATP